MKRLIFEWDDKKNSSNIRKHGVSFEEAQTVFFDENAIEFDDPDHSIQEEQFILLGLSQSLRDLEFIKIPFIVFSYYKKGGATYEDIDFGSEWDIR